MNDRELDDLLRRVPVPERTPDYWADFPDQVRRAAARPEPHVRPAAHVDAGLLVWRWLAAGTALAAVAAGLWLGLRPSAPHPFSADELAGYARTWREVVALFPQQVRGVTFDAAGPHLSLADRPDLPPAPPLLVRICAAHGCESFLTFSGQQITSGGQSYEVLTDAHGTVLLVGRDSVWSSAERSGPSGFAAQSLNRNL